MRRRIEGVVVGRGGLRGVEGVRRILGVVVVGEVGTLRLSLRRRRLSFRLGCVRQVMWKVRGGDEVPSL